MARVSPCRLLISVMDMLNPMKMMQKLMDLPKQLLGGITGGGKEGAGGGGSPFDLLQKLNPMSLLQGLGGAAGERGL